MDHARVLSDDPLEQIVTSTVRTIAYSGDEVNTRLSSVKNQIQAQHPGLKGRDFQDASKKV